MTEFRDATEVVDPEFWTVARTSRCTAVVAQSLLTRLCESHSVGLTHGTRVQAFWIDEPMPVRRANARSKRRLVRAAAARVHWKPTCLESLSLRSTTRAREPIEEGSVIRIRGRSRRCGSKEALLYCRARAYGTAGDGPSQASGDISWVGSSAVETRGEGLFHSPLHALLIGGCMRLSV